MKNAKSLLFYFEKFLKLNKQLINFIYFYQNLKLFDYEKL